jgi:hypothetical protein
VNVTLSIDDQLVASARKKGKEPGKGLNQMIRPLPVETTPSAVSRSSSRFPVEATLADGDFKRDEIHERR